MRFIVILQCRLVAGDSKNLKFADLYAAARVRFQAISRLAPARSRTPEAGSGNMTCLERRVAEEKFDRPISSQLSAVGEQELAARNGKAERRSRCCEVSLVHPA